MKNKTYAPVPAVAAPAVPSGWNIRRDGNVLIVQHPDIGGCSVQKEPDWERMIPESILYSLADALLQSAAQAPVDKRCEYCDGTGDVHPPDGEWRGVCCCVAGEQFRTSTKDSGV